MVSELPEKGFLSKKDEQTVSVENEDPDTGERGLPPTLELRCLVRYMKLSGSTDSANVVPTYAQG